MMRSPQQKRSDKSGMTLAELLVFMTLTLSIMAGLFPMIRQAEKLDIVAEERLSAFFACKSVLEELRNIPFQELTSSGSGFSTTTTGGYEREAIDVPFHTRGGLTNFTITATERVLLLHGRTGESTNCHATVTMEWNSNHGEKTSSVFSESVSTILYL